METLLKPAEVAEVLRLAPQTVRKLAQEKKLSAVRVGALYRFRKSDVEAFIERNVRPPMVESEGRE